MLGGIGLGANNMSHINKTCHLPLSGECTCTAPAGKGENSSGEFTLGGSQGLYLVKPATRVEDTEAPLMWLKSHKATSVLVPGQPAGLS